MTGQRKEALKLVVCHIEMVLRAGFTLAVNELSIDPQEDGRGDITLAVSVSGLGRAIPEHKLDAALIVEHDRHADVLTAEGWEARLVAEGDVQPLAEMPADVFAARMRRKVRP